MILLLYMLTEITIFGFHNSNETYYVILLKQIRMFG